MPATANTQLVVTAKDDQPLPADVMAPPGGKPGHLRRGNPNLNRRRTPPIPERIGAAMSAVFGAEIGELVYTIIEGMKRGSVQSQPGRLILERVLPTGRPVLLNLPQIENGADLARAKGMLIDALNEGRITPDEMRTLQDCIWHAWRHQRVAAAAMAGKR
jgi:hypothetical protein